MLISVQFLIKGGYLPHTTSYHNGLAPSPLIFPKPLNSGGSVESFDFSQKSDLYMIYMNIQDTASALFL